MPYLTQNLIFANNHRVKPGGNTEQMLNHLPTLGDIKVSEKVGIRHFGMSLKKIKACLLSMVTVFIGGINFGTVTGGQDYTLGHVDTKQ